MKPNKHKKRKNTPMMASGHMMTSENFNIDSDFTTAENFFSFNPPQGVVEVRDPVYKNLPYDSPIGRYGQPNYYGNPNAINPYIGAYPYGNPYYGNPYGNAMTPYDPSMPYGGFPPEVDYEEANNEAMNEGAQAESEYEQEADETNDYNQGN